MKLRDFIFGLVEKLPLSKPWRSVVIAILIALGVLGGGTVAVQSQSLGPIWPTYSDRLCSFDNQTCPAWSSLASGGDLSASNDGMSIGGPTIVSSSIAFDSSNGLITQTADTALHLDMPYQQFQDDDAWVGRSSGNSIAFDSASDVVTITVEGITTTYKLYIDQVDGSGAPYVGYTQTQYAANVLGGYGSISCFDSEAENFGCGANTLFGGLAYFATPAYWADYSNNIVAMAEENSGAGANTISGGADNTIASHRSTIGGGFRNTISDTVNTSNSHTISGGFDNEIIGAGKGQFIGGGVNNVITSTSVTNLIVGGTSNTIGGTCQMCVIGGGESNDIQNGNGSTIAGGEDGQVTSIRGTVGGGYGNVVSGDFATIPGGRDNSASGNYSLAGGRRAKASHSGVFVWGDSTDADFASSAADTFNVRATGGSYFGAGGMHLYKTETAKTANYTILVADRTTTFSNKGATSEITFTLPSAAVGLNNCVYVFDAYTVTVKPGGSDQIHALTDAAGNRIQNTGTAGDYVCFEAIDSTYWAPLPREGTWSDIN